MDDLFVVNLGGGDEEGDARREAERLELRDRYARHLVDTAAIDERVAERVMAALFDHMNRDGGRCVCGCHPRLDSLHDAGFDCLCTWDDERRARESARWSELRDCPWAVELRKRQAEEEEAIARWVAGQSGVEARRLTWFAPEQWTGSVDGHSFYFRERHGMWRLELDLERSGRFADRLVEVREEGEMVTEPVPVMEGDVIAEGGGHPARRRPRRARRLYRRDHPGPPVGQRMRSRRGAVLLSEVRPADERPVTAGRNGTRAGTGAGA